jgi:hypothetical protein
MQKSFTIQLKWGQRHQSQYSTAKQSACQTQTVKVLNSSLVMDRITSNRFTLTNRVITQHILYDCVTHQLSHPKTELSTTTLPKKLFTNCTKGQWSHRNTYSEQKVFKSTGNLTFSIVMHERLKYTRFTLVEFPRSLLLP